MTHHILQRKEGELMEPNNTLRFARKAAGFSRERLAEILGVSAMTIYRWERGENVPDPYVQGRLSKLLQLSGQVFGTHEKKGEESCLKESLLFLIDPCLPSSRPTLVGQRLLIKEMGQTSCRMIGITGLPGSGKSALAHALTGLPTLRQQVEGIFWACVGPQPNHLRHLQRWLLLLGEKCVPEQMEEAQDRLQFLLRGREILIVLDDLWQVEDILPYQFPRCRSILTTRFPIVANTVCDGVYRPRLLTEPQAFQLLGQSLPVRLAREHREILRALCQQVGHLPLAIEHLGKYLRREARSFSQRRFQEALSYLFQPASYLHLQMSPDSCSLAASLKRSEAWLPCAAQQAFSALATHLPVAPLAFSERQVTNLIQASGQFHLQDLDQLVDYGLLSAIGRDQYQIHPVVAAYARLRAETEPEITA